MRCLRTAEKSRANPRLEPAALLRFGPRRAHLRAAAQPLPRSVGTERFS
jgi:hypothetical protein